MCRDLDGGGFAKSLNRSMEKLACELLDNIRVYATTAGKIMKNQTAALPERPQDS
jgi:hypothetical protein